MSPAGNKVRNRQAGYTLLELMVVLAILVMIAGGVPALMGKFSPEARLRAATDQAYANLVRLRATARQQGEITALKINDDGGSYRLEPADEHVLLDDGFIIQIAPFGMDQYAADRSAGGRLRFYPGGGSTGGDIRLSLRERTRTINVDWLTSAIRRETGR